MRTLSGKQYNFFRLEDNGKALNFETTIRLSNTFMRFSQKVISKFNDYCNDWHNIAINMRKVSQNNHNLPKEEAFIKIVGK